MTQTEINAAIQEQQDAIRVAQSNLTATDYVAAKIAEGKATKTEYATKIAERQQWRDGINAAQEEIERLKALEPEEETPTTEAENNGGIE